MNEEDKAGGKLLERITMFNDAVYAIALTLLVLELKLPEDGHYGTATEMWHSVKEMLPKLLAFLLSIALVGGNWISSVNMQRTHIKADIGYLIYSVLYLSIVSLAPFVCNVIGNYPDNPVSYVLFGIVVCLIALNGYLYLKHCRKNNLYHADADMNEILKLEKVIPFIVVFVAAIAAVSFYSTTLSFYLFLIYNLLPFFLTKSLKVHHKPNA